MQTGVMAPALMGAASVTRLLLERYGAENVWQVERLNEHFYRARLHSGMIALALVQEDGGVDIRELLDDI